MAVIGTSNINVQSIGTALNEAGGSVDINSPLTFFSNTLNKWSLKKPVTAPDDFYDIDSNITINSADTLSSVTSVPWYVGKQSKVTKSITASVNGTITTFNVTVYYLFRLAIPVVDCTSNIYYIKAVMDTFSTNGFNWEMTSLVSGTPKRLGDFRGYTTSEVKPFQYYVYDTTNESTTMTFYLGGNFSTVADDSTNVHMKHLATVIGTNWEVGALIVDASTEKYETSTTGNSMGWISTGYNLGNIVINNTLFKGTMFPAGDYKAYFALRNTANTALFIPLPHLGTFGTDDSNANPRNFTVTKVKHAVPKFVWSLDLSDVHAGIWYCKFKKGISTTTSYPEGIVQNYAVKPNTGLCSYMNYAVQLVIDAKTEADTMTADSYTYKLSDMTFDWATTHSGIGAPSGIAMYSGTTQVEQITVSKGSAAQVWIAFTYIFGSSATASNVTWTMPNEKILNIKMPISGQSISDEDCITIQMPICITKASAALYSSYYTSGGILELDGSVTSN